MDSLQCIASTNVSDRLSLRWPNVLIVSKGVLGVQAVLDANEPPVRLLAIRGPDAVRTFVAEIIRVHAAGVRSHGFGGMPGDRHCLRIVVRVQTTPRSP